MANLTYEQALAKLYTKAEANLIKTIRRKTAHGNATSYERSLLRQVDEQIKALQKSSDKLVRKLVRSNYKKGLDKLAQDLAVDKSAPKSYPLMSRLNINQINLIVDNMTQQLNMATATIGRRCNDLIRQVSLDAMAQKLTQGKTIREMQKELEKRLQNQNITSVTYANGTNHNLKDYASMVARTTTTETQNTAQFVQGKDWGYDLVRMTSHFPTCSVCAMYQGRVYATTKEASNGKYKDKNGNPLRFSYLYDTVLVDGYDTVHPNCRHRFSIFPPKAYTLDELAEFSRQSIQPFSDNRSDTERKAYAQEQATKRKRNASRRQYEKIKNCFPDKAPKTFAGWQRMKSTNSQRYRDLLKDYRNLQKNITSKSSGNGSGTKSSLPVLFGTLDFNDEKAIINSLGSFEKSCKGLTYERCRVITSDGKIWDIDGSEGYVITETIQSQQGGSSLVGSYSYHNHPKKETHFSFSGEDAGDFLSNAESMAKASDYKYAYTMTRTNETLNAKYEDVKSEFKSILNNEVLERAFWGEVDFDENGYHETMIILSQKYKFNYERKLIDDK